VHSTVNVSSGRSKLTALGALTLLGRAGAAISSLPAGFGDLARERGRKRRPRRKARSMEQKQRTTNTLTLPFAAIPRPLPERKELL